MDRVEIESRLRDVLVSELGVDSLGVVELLMAMEDEFGVKIPDDEAEHIHTVGEAIELVHTKLNA